MVSTGTKVQRERGAAGRGEGGEEGIEWLCVYRYREGKRDSGSARASVCVREREQVSVYYQSLHTCNRVRVVSVPAYVHVFLHLLAHDPASAGEAIGNFGVWHRH